MKSGIGNKRLLALILVVFVCAFCASCSNSNNTTESKAYYDVCDVCDCYCEETFSVEYLVLDFCPNCAEDLLFFCAGCESYQPAGSLGRHIDETNKFYCDDCCFNLMPCHFCENVNSGLYHLPSDNYICGQCLAEQIEALAPDILNKISIDY